MDGRVEHTVTIEHIDGEAVDVVMHVEGACQSCKAQKLCGMDEGGEKRVTIHTDLAGEFAVGEQVVVSITREMSVKAVAVAYIYPFILMLVTLLVLLESGVTELVAGLASLGVLAAYFFVVWLLRGRIEKQMVFKLRKA
ncbi:MAG: SoxR reducing system RseC family protein [Rikenellaceae bacterium]|nr:SoxR reducing system RseC family protein [Rikenellaceae bacterium]